MVGALTLPEPRQSPPHIVSHRSAGNSPTRGNRRQSLLATTHLCRPPRLTHLNFVSLWIGHLAHGLDLLLAASLSCLGPFARAFSFYISSIRTALLFLFALSLGVRPFRRYLLI